MATKHRRIRGGDSEPAVSARDSRARLRHRREWQDHRNHRIRCRARLRKPSITTSTPLRIASVTKTVTAVVALQLVEEGKLDLDAPARRYAPGLRLPDDVLIRHLLTHTSEGHLGVEYVYGTTRYAMLEEVIEAILGESFEAVIRERILDRARMQVHPSPALGAHTGLVSTTDDMAAYLAALDLASCCARRRWHGSSLHRARLRVPNFP